MNLVFRIVADGLNWVASITGFTYNEINIIAYYIVLPFIYVALLDRMLERHFLKVAYIIIWGLIIGFVTDFRVFSDELFKHSVDFLLQFDRVGLNYIAASVVICVVLPATALVVLFLLAFPSARCWSLRKSTKLASVQSVRWED